MDNNTMRISSEILFAAIEEQLAAGLNASFTVTGMSMWPFLCHGRDRVIVTGTSPDDLAVGDIILFCPVPGKYILHRITALQEDAFETTGDGCCCRDGWRPRECVRAKVTCIVRKGKTISCSSPFWRFIRHLEDPLSLQGTASPTGQNVQQCKMPETVMTSDPVGTCPAFSVSNQFFPPASVR